MRKSEGSPTTTSLASASGSRTKEYEKGRMNGMTHKPLPGFEDFTIIAEPEGDTYEIICWRCGKSIVVEKNGEQPVCCQTKYGFFDNPPRVFATPLWPPPYHMVRKGECKRCGQCCRKIIIPIEPDPDLIRWAGLRGLDVRHSLRNHEEAQVHLDQTCNKLVENPDGTCSCGTEGKRKPRVCMDWPFDPMCFKEAGITDCGFWFERDEAQED